MKKILLATSALVLTAAAANAQAVRIGGEGRMGILWESYSQGAASVNNWAQENRLQLNFSVTVEADHGLTFGAFSRVRINNGAVGVFSGSRVFVEANSFRLTFGNVDGAIRGAGVSHGYAGGCGIGYVGGHFCGDTAGLVGGIGGIGVATARGVSFMPGQTQGFASTAGGPAARIRIDYSFGDTRLALSTDRNGATEIGVRSRFDAFTVALGYSNRANVANANTAVATAPIGVAFGSTQVPGNVIALSGHYNGGTWGVGLLAVRVSYSGALSPLTHTNYSLSGNVELGGGNLYGYVGRVFHASAAGAPLAPNLRAAFNVAGISYSYGLGGGATLTAGIERFSGSPAGVSVRGTSASVGVAFNF